MLAVWGLSLQLPRLAFPGFCAVQVSRGPLEARDMEVQSGV